MSANEQQRELGVIDRMLLKHAPNVLRSKLLAREQCKRIMALSGYKGANDSRFRNSAAFGRSRATDEDRHLTRYDRERLVLELRDKVRNSEIPAGLVGRFADYVVWTGIRPQARTGDPTRDREYEQFWAQSFARVCDFRQSACTNITTFQELAVRERMVAGCSGWVMVNNGQVLPIEGDRIRTPAALQGDPNVVNGIRRSANGITLGYYVCDRGKQGYVDSTKYQYFRRENFIYLKSPKRIDEMAGIPDLAPLVDKFIDFDETDENVLNKVKMDATKGWGIFDEDGRLPGNLGDRDVTPTGQTQKVEKHSFGEVYRLGRGKIESLASKTPNQEYVPYLKHHEGLIAMCVGIPVEYLMMMFTAGSFSAQLAAKMNAMRLFFKWHAWLSQNMLQRLWNWRIAMAIMDGDVGPARVDERGVSQWFRVEWQPPERDLTDPDKESAANQRRWNTGETNLRLICGASGRDRDEVLAGKLSDIVQAQRLADEANARMPGLKLTWRDIISTLQPGQTSPSTDPDQPPAGKDASTDATVEE